MLYSAAWQFGRYPLSMYRQPTRFLVTYVLPMAFIATVPAMALTRGVDFPTLAGGAVPGIVSIVIVNLVWQRSLRRYTSATS